MENITIGESDLKLLYEAPNEGCSYGCHPADIVKLLSLVSKFVPALPDIIAFRQPTRKQQQQNPVWGRFLYYAEFGEHEGTAIMLEAQMLGAPLKWSNRMSVEERAEYERLVCDGHEFVESKRYRIAKLTEEAVRNTKLYRTFLHELGHLADYHQKVLDKRTALARNQDVADSLYFSRPTSEREVFAHRFAENLKETLLESGEIPFAPQAFARTNH